MQSAARIALRRSRTSRTLTPKKQEQTQKPIYVRSYDNARAEPPSSQSPRDLSQASGSVLEARLHAAVDIARSKRLRLRTQEHAEGRPAPREIPLGEKRRGRKDIGLSLQQGRAVPSKEVSEGTSSTRRKPAFRQPVRLQQDHAEEVDSPGRNLGPSFSPNRSTASGASRNTQDKAVFHRSLHTASATSASRVRSLAHAHNDKDRTTHFIRSLPPPVSSRELHDHLRRIRQLDGHRPHTMQKLIEHHNTWHNYANTSTYNAVLQSCTWAQDMRTQNEIFMSMEERSVPRDATSWDILLESFARHGRWKELVKLYEKRQEEGVPVTRIGWTRMLQAATRNGTTSLLSEEELAKSMSPIYSAVYTLPKGVRQAQLRQMSQNPKMDVDQLLAAMMPPNMLPLDYHASKAVAHRLAKQRRWREADDVAALWLDQLMYQLNSDVPVSGSDTPLQQCLNFLHILIEGLVVNRTEPEAILAFIESYLERYASLIDKPNYQTLFLLLTAYRSFPWQTSFLAGMDMYESFSQKYGLSVANAEDLYGDSRCRRQLQTYGAWGMRAATGKERHADIGRRIRERMKAADIDKPALAGVPRRYTQSSAQPELSHMIAQRMLEEEAQKQRNLRQRTKGFDQYQRKKASRQATDSASQTVQQSAKEQVGAAGVGS